MRSQSRRFRLRGSPTRKRVDIQWFSSGVRREGAVFKKMEQLRADLVKALVHLVVVEGHVNHRVVSLPEKAGIEREWGCQLQCPILSSADERGRPIFNDQSDL